MTKKELDQQLIMVLTCTALALKTNQANSGGEHEVEQAIERIRYNVDKLRVGPDWQRTMDVNG
jgi:hypothetical protein